MMREALAVTRALGDPTRLRILMALDGHELCVCQIIELVRLAPATVSKHLSILYQAGFLESRKVGRWVFYRFEPAGRSAGTRAALWRQLRKSLQAEETILADRKRLTSLLRINPELLCRRQTGKRQAR